jgi:hypothetical protein
MVHLEPAVQFYRNELEKRVGKSAALIYVTKNHVFIKLNKSGSALTAAARRFFNRESGVGKDISPSIHEAAKGQALLLLK